jgi:hypothetical protein
MERRASVRPWLSATVKHVWLIVTGIFLNVIGGAQTFAGVAFPVVPPWVLIVVGVLCWLGASFLAFHEARTAMLRMAAEFDAASVIGMLVVDPDLRVSKVADSEGYTVELAPSFSMQNHSPKALTVRLERLETTVKDSEDETTWSDGPNTPKTLAPGGAGLEIKPGETQVKPGEIITVQFDYSCTYAPPSSRTGVAVTGSLLGRFEIRAPAVKVSRGWAILNEEAPRLVEIDPRVGLWAH